MKCGLKYVKVIFDAFLNRKASLSISNRQECDGRLPFCRIIPSK